MSRRAAPGRRIGGGSLRVDAARAVMKLRDYQLPEPEMWILELLRAGVTLGAESIRVEGDADDIRVSWEGPAPEVDDLTTLLDELVNPVASEERRHLRLMATAINTALGLSPRYVDIYVSSDEAGPSSRVRFTPSILEVDDDDPLAGASKLRDLEAEKIALPPGAPARGVLVHLRRFPDLGVLNTFVSGREPPELRIVRDSCDDTRVPISIGDGVMVKERSDRDVLRIPLGPGVDGFMALMRATTRPDWARPAIFEAAERGVLLSRHPVELGFTNYAAIPIRVSVDADRLPTNASRSDVRRGDAPIALAEKRAPEVFEALVKRLAKELGPDAERQWSESEKQTLQRSTFALLAAALATGDFREQISGILKGPLAPLTELPLLRDAFGRPKTLREIAPLRGDNAFVYRGDEPLRLDLEEWLEDLIWIERGDPQELLLSHAPVEDVAARIREAEKSLVARKRYLRYPEHDGRVAQAEGQLLSIDLAGLPTRVAASPSALSAAFFSDAELSGELCLGTPVGRAVVSYLYDGRLLARRRIASPIAFEAVVSSALLTPNADFSGLYDDDGAEMVDRTLVAAAVWAAECLARRLLDEQGEHGTPRRRFVRTPAKLRKTPETYAVLRSGIAAHRELFLFGIGDIFGPLTRAGAFYVATVTGERRWASLDEIRAGIVSGTLFVTGAEATLRENPGLPAGRVIVSGTNEDLTVLRAHLPKKTKVVRYTRRELSTARDAASLARELATTTGAALCFERDQGFGAIGFSATHKSRLDVRHCGHQLERHTPQELDGPTTILFEGPQLVPRPQKRSSAGGSVPKLFQIEELALVRAVAMHLLGDDVPGLFVADGLFDEQTVPLFLERLGAMGLGKALDEELRARVEALPLFSVLGRDEPVSLEELARLHPKSLRWLEHTHVIDFDVGGFHPLRAPERLAKAVASMLGKKRKHAAAELERRHQKHLRRQRLVAHREAEERAELPIGDDELAVDMPEGSLKSPRVRLSLPEVGKSRAIEILVDDRFARDLDASSFPPVWGVARMRATAMDSRFEDLTDRAKERLAELIGAGVPALLARVAELEPDRLRRDARVQNLLDWWLENRPEGMTAELGEDARTVAEAPIFDTVQGDKASALDALRRTKVYVASYVGMWIGPDEGETAHSLDRAVIRVAEGAEGNRQITLLKGLTGREVGDVTRACEQLQARRRVAQGLVPKPTLHGHSGVSRVHDVAALVGKDRVLRSVLGPGEIGLSDSDESRVFIQRDGVYIGAALVDVSPPVLVTLESPDVPRKIKKIKPGGKLAKRVQQLTGRLVRRLVRDDGLSLLDAREKRKIRSAVLAGAVLADDDRSETLPLYETTAGLWFSKEALREQYARFSEVWYVPDFDSEELALDEERHVFRMTSDDATQLLGDILLLTDATDELRLDAEARRNRQRRPVDALELEYGEQRGAVAWEVLAPKGDEPIEGIVAPLRPGLDAHRGLRLSRARHPLGEHADPCEWPTRAVIDAPSVAPNRTWSGADAEDASFEKLEKAVRRASEKALKGLVEIPKDALEPRRIGAAQCRRDGAKHPVRGALWATREVGKASVRVVDRGGVRELASSMAELPLEGVLYVDGPPSSDAAEVVAESVYRRILGRLSRRLANEWDPLKAAHLIHGLATERVEVADLPGEHAWPLGVLRPIDPATVRGWLSGSLGVVWVVKKDEVEDAKRIFAEAPGGPSEDNPWLVDDGSMAFRALSLHLGWRAKAWPPPASASAPDTTSVHALFEEATRSAGIADGAADDEPGSVAVPAESVEFDTLLDPRSSSGAPGGPLSSPSSPSQKISAPAPEPPKMDVAHFVLERLAVAGVSASVRVVPSKRRAILRRNGGDYELAGRNPLVAAVQAAIDGGDPRAHAALAVLAARVVGEANRQHDEVTDAHELDALTTLLGTRQASS